MLTSQQMRANETAWLLESDMPDADGRILYLCDAPDWCDNRGDRTSLTHDVNAAKRFDSESAAVAFRNAEFANPSRLRCQYCGHDPGDGRLRGLRPREHMWPL